MHILICTFEYPPAQAGGLGRMVEDLCRELKKYPGTVVSVAMPSHGLQHISGQGKFYIQEKLFDVDIKLSDRKVHISILIGRNTTTPDIPIYLVAGPWLDSPNPYDSLDEKVAIYARALIHLVEHFAWCDFPVDILHAHDWHSAVGACLSKIRTRSWQKEIPLLYTVHRIGDIESKRRTHFLHWIGFQDYANIEEISYHCGFGYEYISLEALGAYTANIINTVSKSYLADVVNFFGKSCFHFDAKSKSTYVFNGITVDQNIIKTFDIDEKPKIREKVLAEIGLHNAVMVFLISRFDSRQKGVNVLLNAIDIYFSRRWLTHWGDIVWDTKFILKALGGEHNLIQAAKAAEARYPDNIRFIRHWIDDITPYYKGADIVVVPSSFEPFGLIVSEAMSCGAIIVGSDVGGIRDQVVDYFKERDAAFDKKAPPTGFTFWTNNSQSLADKLTESVAIAKSAFLANKIGIESDVYKKFLNSVKTVMSEKIWRSILKQPTLLKKLAKNSIKRSLEFHISYNGRGYMDIYKKIG